MAGMGTDFQMSGAPLPTAGDTSSVPYAGVSGSAGLNYGLNASFTAGSPIIWFGLIVIGAFLIYHMS